MHTSTVHPLNATIHASKLLIRTTFELKSINDTRAHSKNNKKKTDVILVQRAEQEGNERQRSNKTGLRPTAVFLAVQRKTIACSVLSHISVTHNNDNTQRKYFSVWVN